MIPLLPDPTLSRIRELADRFVKEPHGNFDRDGLLCEELALLIRALDRHLVNGGDLPKPWLREGAT